jgi:transposase
MARQHDEFSLSRREERRLRIIEYLARGDLDVAEASVALGISERQVFRLKAAYEREGVRGLAHGNRGRTPANRLQQEERQRIVELATETYAGTNRSHLRDLLALNEGIMVGTSTVSRVLAAAGLAAPGRSRRRARHRLRRERRAQEGMLIQVDGSDHHWFGKDRARVTLVAGIDDATGKVVGAVFRGREDAQGYLLLVQQIVTRHGVPLEIYHDRHGIFERNQAARWTLEEELRGRLDPTQVNRALEALGIASTPAFSPQAKGRIERLWGTWQDRLVRELALAGITDIDAANAFLPGYVERHNRRFSVHADDPALAYQHLPAGTDLDFVLSFQYERRVANDNTVQLNGQRYQIPPGTWRRSYAQSVVLVCLLLDGRVGIWHQGGWLLQTSTPDAPPVLRTLRRKRYSQAPLAPPPPSAQVTLPEPSAKRASPPKPGPNHPWRNSGRPAQLTESLTS